MVADKGCLIKPVINLSGVHLGRFDRIEISSNISIDCYFEVDAVFNREPVELLEESTWTAGLRTGNNTGEEVLGFLEFGDVFLSGVSVVEAGANESTCNHFGHIFRYRGTDVV